MVDGKLVGKTILEIKIDRKKMHNVTIKKEGKERTYILDKKIGKRWLFLDSGFGIGSLILYALSSTSPEEFNTSEVFFVSIIGLYSGFLIFLVEGTLGFCYSMAPQEINVDFEQMKSKEYR